MFCTNCGAQQPNDTKFCANCGAPMRKPGAVPPGKPGSVPSAEAPGNRCPAAIPAPRTPAQPAAPRGPHSKKPLVIGISAVVVIAIAAVVGHIVWSQFFAPYPIDRKTFPDDEVRTAIAAYDTDGDDYLSREEAKSVDVISVTDATSLNGLELCPNIRSIEVHIESEPMRELNLCGLANLERLYVACVDADDVTIEHLPKLISIDMGGVTANELSLSGLDSLEYLLLGGSVEEGELDLSENTNLEYVSVHLDGLDKVKLPQTDTLATLSVDDDIDVEGAEAVGFSEVWVPLKDEYGYFSIKRDGEGNILSMNACGYDYEYEYDVDGNLKSIKSQANYETRPQTDTYYVDDDGNLQDSDYAYTYDDQGRVTHVARRGLESHYLEYTYDDAGNVVKVYDARGNGLPYVYTYAYDEDGRVTRASQVDDETGETLVSRTFAYDEDGHLQQITHDNISGVMVGQAETSTFSYNEKTRTLTGSSTLPEKAGGRTRYLAIQYNERGDVVAFDESSSTELTSAEDGNKITYARYFVKEGERKPSQGIRVDVTYDTYADAQIDTMFSFYKEGPEMALEADPYVDQSAYPRV